MSVASKQDERNGDEMMRWGGGSNGEGTIPRRADTKKATQGQASTIGQMTPAAT